MARIPLVSAPGGQVAPRQIGIDPSAFGAGVANALATLAGTYQENVSARESLATAYQASLEKQSLFKSQRLVQDYEKNAVLFVGTAKQTLPDDGSGFTNAVFEELEKRKEDLLGRIQFPDVRRRVESDLTATNNRLVLDAFNTEYAAKTQYFKTELETAVNSAQSDIYAGTKTREEVEASLGELLKNADLPDVDKAAIARGIRARLAMSEFKREVSFRETSDPGSTGFPKLFEALIYRESAGRSDAIGPEIPGRDERAIGLGQVLPSTAMDPGLPGVQNVFEIAEALGVPVPSRDAAGAEELLKNANVNSTIASQYLRALLSKYGGDVEAALVAYNAGPGRADEWLAASRDYSIFASDVKGYVNDILTRADPDRIFTDPRFSDIPFETKEVLADDAVREARQRQAAREAEAEALQKQVDQEVLKQAALSPEYGHQQNNQLLADGTIKYSVWNTAREAIERKFKDTNDLLRGAEMIQGGILGIPENADDRSALNAYVRRPGGIIQMMQAQDANVFPELNAVLSQVRMMPPAVAQQLGAMMQSGTMDEAKFAYGLLAKLQTSGHLGPVSASFPDATLADARAFELLSRTQPVDEVLQHLRGQNLPQMKALREQAQEALKEDFKSLEDIDAFLAKHFQTLWPGDDVDPSPFLRVNQAFLETLLDVYPIEYARFNGNAEAAQASTAEALKRLFGVTSVGADTRLSLGALVPHQYLTMYPPEHEYRAWMGNHDWMEEQVYQALPDIRGRAFFLQSDEQTARDVEFKRTANPRARDAATGFDIPNEIPGVSYSVWVEDDLGRLVQVKRQDGVDARVSFEIYPDMRQIEVMAARVEAGRASLETFAKLDPRSYVKAQEDQARNEGMLRYLMGESPDIPDRPVYDPRTGTFSERRGRELPATAPTETPPAEVPGPVVPPTETPNVRGPSPAPPRIIPSTRVDQGEARFLNEHVLDLVNIYEKRYPRGAAWDMAFERLREGQSPKVQSLLEELYTQFFVLGRVTRYEETALTLQEINRIYFDLFDAGFRGVR